jgi:hypothetical protein
LDSQAPRGVRESFEERLHLIVNVFAHLGIRFHPGDIAQDLEEALRKETNMGQVTGTPVVWGVPIVQRRDNAQEAEGGEFGIDVISVFPLNVT